MSDGSATIYYPQTGRKYRIHVDGKVFIGRVIGWDEETVDVMPIEASEPMQKSVNLKRNNTRFESWV